MKKFLSLFAIFTLFILGGCSKNDAALEEPVIPEITVSKESYVVSKAGSTINININVTTPDGKWKYTVSNSGKNWCTASTKMNSNTLKVVVSPNNDESRETTISVMAESDSNLRKTIKIKQAGVNDGIVAEQTSFEVSSRNHTLSVPFYATVKFDVEIEEGVDWITYKSRNSAKEDAPLEFAIGSNPSVEPREATVTITSKEPKESITLKIKQRGKDSVANADVIPSDAVVKIEKMSSSATSANGGLLTIKNAYDGDMDTWYGATSPLPVTFTCTFKNAKRIDYVDIYPGKGEGIWGEVDVYGKEEGGESTLIGSYDFEQSKETRRLYFTLNNPVEVKFVVRTAKVYASITAAMHEIIFYCQGATDFNELEIFTDRSCAELRDDVTEEMIEAIPNEFYRDLASYIFSGEYDTKYRAAYYDAYPHPDIDSKRFRTGAYTLLDNITGMYFDEGEHVVFIDDTYGFPIYLNIINYYKNDSGDLFQLNPGINKINVQNKGLAYVRYHTEDPKAKPVRINFPTALVNGYYDIIENPEADVRTLLNNARSELFDMRGARSVYTFPVKYFQQFCGTTKKAFDTMQQADSIIYLQEEFQGHHKHNTGGHRNRMLYHASIGTSFMFASAYRTGYSMHENYGDSAIKGILDPQQLRWNAWGPYHEVGHVNQTTGFKWAGMGEVSNNICSMYCVMKFRGWGESDYVFTEGKEYIKDANGNVLRTHNDRYEAAWAEIANKGENPKVYSVEENPFFKLVPLWQLYLYNTKVMGRNDFYPDMYQTLRTTEVPDDYGAQQVNFAKICCDVAKEDLTEFFEKWGFFTICDEVIDDYGNKRLTVTAEMVKAVKDHAAQYPKPTKKNIWLISNYNMQKFIDGDGSNVIGFDTPRL